MRIEDLNKILDKITTAGVGGFGISLNDKNGLWGASLEWGKEAEDSDMYGAAAYGTGTTPEEALQDLLHDAGITDGN